MGKQVNICIDIGNTRIKSGRFEGEELVALNSWNLNAVDALPEYVRSQKADRIAIVSVNKTIGEMHTLFTGMEVSVITKDSNFPITLNYHTPDTLGIDRLVGLIGAIDYFSNTPILTIDVGSCLTYDILDQNKTYQGGVIAPGLKMRMSAMNLGTRNLPDVAEEWQEFITSAPGKSTKECLVLGTYQAIIHEINGFIDDFKRKFPGLRVILTGGDAPSFESKLKEPIFADPNLVLKGLNRILNH